MNEFEGRLQTIMDVALDQVFTDVRHGGDHESRKTIALQLAAAARAGRTTLDELVAIGRRAMIDLRNRSRVG
jgi:hypothetical protein